MFIFAALDEVPSHCLSREREIVGSRGVGAALIPVVMGASEGSMTETAEPQSVNCQGDYRAGGAESVYIE